MDPISDHSPARVAGAVHGALAEAGLPHAIGGALALGCYAEARPAADVDVNVFVPVTRWREAVAALEPLGIVTEVDSAAVEREGEARLDCDGVEVHLFFSRDELHEEMAADVRRARLGGAELPVVSAEHLVVRKLLLGRPKDVADVERIRAAVPSLDEDEIAFWRSRLGGAV